LGPKFLGLSTFSGDAAVGEEVGRVGEDEVDGRFGEKGEEFEGVALVEADVVARVVEDGGWEFDGGFGGHGGLIDQDR
jgi:hypothetical protein